MRLQQDKPGSSRLAAIGSVLLLMAGCQAVNEEPAPSNNLSAEARQVCDILTDEVIEGFIFAIENFRDDGLAESDAITQWAEGCDNIPANGNFQGDVATCQSCLTALVRHVYSPTTE